LSNQLSKIQTRLGETVSKQNSLPEKEQKLINFQAPFLDQQNHQN